MRVDSCRKCGKEFQPKKICKICSCPLKFECKECMIDSDEQIHFECRLVEINNTSLCA